jgi:4'-phosphopantetheinyl transferase
VAACVGREGVEGIEILAGEDGAPIVGLAGEPTRRIALSLSHSDGRGFAAATAEPTALGCDLEAVARRTSEFIGDYLTQSERDRVLGVRDSARDAAANLVWSAKEAALKALRQGLRMDTRLVGVQFGEFPPADGGWAPLTLHGPGSEPFTGWWRRLDGYAWAVVTRGPGRPFLIESPQSPRVAD